MVAAPGSRWGKPADNAALARLLDARTAARGRSYAEAGAVLDWRWEDRPTLLTGEVRGNSPEPYSVSVQLSGGPAGTVTRVVARCTCPVGLNCKHAAALILTAGALGPAAAAPATAGPGTPGPVERAPAWADRLEGLLGSESRDGDPDGWSGAGDGALGLQFELVEARPAPARRPSSGPGIRVRPVTLSPSGNWVRTGVSWSSLDYYQGWRHGGYRADHLGLLRELRALARLSDNRRWGVTGDEAVWLESIASRRLWDLLRHADEAGLAMMTAGRPNGPVMLGSQPVEIALDLVRTAGGLEVSAVLVHRDSRLAASSAMALGAPAHGLAWWEPSSQTGQPPAIHLAPFAGRPTTAALELIRSGGGVTVPAAEVGRFESGLLARLARRMPVRSRDGSFEVPEPVDDTVIARIEHRPGPALDLSWWLDQDGRRRPIDDEPDGGAAKAIAAAVDVLWPVGGLVVGTFRGLMPAGRSLAGMDAVRFCTDVAADLSAVDGLIVEQVGDLPDFREAPEGPTLTVGGSASPDGDWLDLAVEVTLDGEAVAFESLFAALAEGAEALVLPSGRWFSLDRPDLRRLAELIAEARSLADAPPGRTRISRFQASLWEDLQEIAAVEGAAGWADGLRALAGDPATRAVPAGITAELRPYQLDGFGWLAARYEQRIGAILADDMGLGKTVQALAVICHTREAGLTTDPFLVVAPTSVVGNWAAEAARFAPGLEVAVIGETAARSGRSIADVSAEADVVITSYALFRIDYDSYEAVRWAGLLLDEAQFVKNPKSQGWQRARRLAAPWKLAMTGTPLENSLTELWALTAVAAPGLFPRADRFAEAYRNPIERQGDPERLERLRRRLRPVMLRRTKAEVVADLPDKQEQVVTVDLDARHRRFYDTLLHRERQKVLGLLGDLDANRFEILRSLTLLRQAALDVSLVEPDRAPVPSAKLDLLVEMVTEAAAEGHRLLVFSQFTRFLGQARRRIEAAGIATCYLDGRTRKRAEVIDGFRAGRAPVFLISLKAGGFGLNLTEADHCVLLDPWWNPATETQAVDRAHRIGQTRKVMVYRYVARDTIEEKVMALKARKAELFAGVMGSGEFASAALSAADVAELLS